MTKHRCAKCAELVTAFRIERGLPVCDPECAAYAQLSLVLPRTEADIRAANLRFALTGAL